jgi:hypothetical protein
MNKVFMSKSFFLPAVTLTILLRIKFEMEGDDIALSSWRISVKHFNPVQETLKAVWHADNVVMISLSYLDKNFYISPSPASPSSPPHRSENCLYWYLGHSSVPSNAPPSFGLLILFYFLFQFYHLFFCQ